MTATIALLLLQDGLTTGLVYALLALSILLVFVVTRVLWIPAGDFLVLGALTLAMLRQGAVPGTVWLLMAIGVAAALVETVRVVRTRDFRHYGSLMAVSLALPAALAALVGWLAPLQPPLPVQVLLVLALIGPMGFLLYRAAFRPLAERSTLLLMFVAVAVHYTLTGLGLVFFGSEGFRTPPFIPGRWDIGVTRLSWHLLVVVGVSALIMVAMALFFGRSLWGRAMRGTAVNRLGARLVGIRPDRTGALAFVIATLIGALSGILIAPVTPLYYDSGFLIGLKGFTGVVMGGMASFPLAVLGALVVGLTESVASFYASALKEALVFALIVPFLLWRSAVEPRADAEHGA